MELDRDDQQFVSRANVSPFFTSSKASAASPQSWDLHDVDYLLPDPVVTSTRSCFQDSSRKYSSCLHECEIEYSSEFDDTVRPLAFRSGAYWQDMSTSEAATSEFSTFVADDVFTDKVVAASKSPSSESSHGKLKPLLVHASTCIDEDLVANIKNQVNVVSPTTVHRKMLVTDNDLRLFSVANMRTLNRRKGALKSSQRLGHHTKMAKVCPAPTLSVPRTMHCQHIKHCASLEGDIDDHAVRALRKTTSLDQSAWCAPAFDPRWYLGHTEGLHGIQPKLWSPMHSSTPMGYSGTNLYRLTHHQVSLQQPQQPLNQHFQLQYETPKRKIGIYSPAERRERLKRFHEKRKLRVYHKRIKYDCRKRLANSCPRIRGRFVRKSEFLQGEESVSTSSPPTSESVSSTEDCQL